MEIFLSAEAWIALATLTFLEIVLGIDNIIFISLVSNKLPEEQQPKARFIGLSAALFFRIALLLGITWIIGFTKPLFTLFSMEFSGRDIILMLGGFFLLAKSTSEIHHKIEGEENYENNSVARGMLGTVIQIVLLDIIFSFDSILTAIGMTSQLIIMILAVVIAIIIMMILAKSISNFINNHPTLQILALSFLILIGFMLILESFQFHIPKGYIYFSVAFSLFVEILNIRFRKKRKKKQVKSMK